MFLLTIFNPFLTRELRITGFKGVPTEICLKQRADKTDRQHACKTEYLVMFHGREESVKSTNVARNRRMSTDSNSQLERAAWQDGGAYTSFSRHRVRTPSSARSGPAQCRRWASADLSQGPAYKSRPGLFSRQGPNRGARLRQADRQTCRAVGVSRDRQRLRRLLSCLPASKPDFRFVLSVPLSVE